MSYVFFGGGGGGDKDVACDWWVHFDCCATRTIKHHFVKENKVCSYLKPFLKEGHTLLCSVYFVPLMSTTTRFDSPPSLRLGFFFSVDLSHTITTRRIAKTPDVRGKQAERLERWPAASAFVNPADLFYTLIVRLQILSVIKESICLMWSCFSVQWCTVLIICVCLSGDPIVVFLAHLKVSSKINVEHLGGNILSPPNCIFIVCFIK